MALISMHSCTLDAKIKLNLGRSQIHLCSLPSKWQGTNLHVIYILIFFYSPAQKPRLWRCPPSSRSLQRGNRSVRFRVYVYALLRFGALTFLCFWFLDFLFGRKKSSATEPKTKRAKTVKKGKDPNKRKRPPTAFFIFMYAPPPPSRSLLHLVILFVLF